MAGRPPPRLTPDDGTWDDSLLLDAYVASMASLRLGEADGGDDVGDSGGGAHSAGGVGDGNDEEAGGSAQDASGSIQEDASHVSMAVGHTQAVSANDRRRGDGEGVGWAGDGCRGDEAGDGGGERPGGGGNVRGGDSGSVFEVGADVVSAVGVDASLTPDAWAAGTTAGTHPLPSLSPLTSGRQQGSASPSSVDGLSAALAPRGPPIAEETSPAHDDSDSEWSAPIEAHEAIGGESTTAVADGWRVAGSPATNGVAVTPDGGELVPADVRSVGDIGGSATCLSLPQRPGRGFPPRPPRGHTLRPGAGVPPPPVWIALLSRRHQARRRRAVLRYPPLRASHQTRRCRRTRMTGHGDLGGWLPRRGTPVAGWGLRMRPTTRRRATTLRRATMRRRATTRLRTTTRRRTTTRL